MSIMTHYNELVYIGKVSVTGVHHPTYCVRRFLSAQAISYMVDWLLYFSANFSNR